MRPALAILFALFCSSATNTSAYAAREIRVPGEPSSPEALAKELSRRIVQVLREEAGIPGLSVAVSVDNALVWSEAMGYANLETRTPATTDTKFRIASISKCFTGVGAALLAEQGKLDLDAPIHDYLPEYPALGHRISARHLAGHQSGIRHYNPGEVGSAVEYPTLISALPIFAFDALKFEPGTNMSYSTFGYTALGAVMERAANQGFADYMHREVFAPLGMRHTEPDHRSRLIEQRSASYEYDDFGHVINARPTSHIYKLPGGGFLSTAEDLALFGTALTAPDTLSAEVIDTVTSPMPAGTDHVYNYAMGLTLSEDAQGRQLYGHGGNQPGGRGYLLIYPDQRVVVALLTNIYNAPIGITEAEMIAAPFLQMQADSLTPSSPADPTGTFDATLTRASDGKVEQVELHIWQTPTGWSGNVSSQGRHLPIHSVHVNGDDAQLVIFDRRITVVRLQLGGDTAEGIVLSGERRKSLSSSITRARPIPDEMSAPWYYEWKFWQRAADGYLALAQDNPDDRETQFRLGDALLMIGTDFERAAAASARAAEMGYETATAHFNAARAFAQLKRKDEALQHLLRATEAGFSNPERLRTDPLLDSIRLEPQFIDLVTIGPQ